MDREITGTGSVKNRILDGMSAIGFSPPRLALLLILAVAPLFIQNEYIMRLVLVSLYFGAQAMVFDFTGGYIGICNFGFAGFVGVGAYVSGVLAANLGLSPWVGMIAGAAFTGVVGFFTGVLTLRLRGIYANCMTWFLALTFMAIIAAAVDITRGRWGLNVPLLLETTEIRPYFYILLPIVIVMYVALKMIIDSKIGLAFRAIGQNVDVALASGVDPVKYKVFNLTLSCALAGLLGSFYAHFIGVLTPEVLSTAHSIEVLTLSYVGGRGTLWGGMLVAFFFIPFFEYLKPLMDIRLVIYGALLIGVMIFYPSGLAGFLKRVPGLIKRAAERRNESRGAGRSASTAGGSEVNTH